MRYLACAVFLILAACSPKSDSMPANVKAGDLDASGRLIFWSIGAFDHVEPFTLHSDDFGVVLYNHGSEEAPAAGYILAFQKTREIVHTGDFSVFKQALAKVPKGSTIGRYDTCSVPRSYGLPGSVITEFEQALKVAGLRVEMDARRVCYCTNGNR